MSSFLAAIHYKQYEKIKNQELIVEDILKLNDEENWLVDLEKNVDKEIGILKDSPLENIIDKNNIHGWLSSAIDIVEKRLAYIVSQIIKEEDKGLEKILSRVKSLGEKESRDNYDNISEVYSLIDDKFLNGMPCDRVNEIIDRDESFLTWKMHKDIHSKYWDKENSKIYYRIKNSYIDGLLKNSNISYLEVEENIFKLIKSK